MFHPINNYEFNLLNIENYNLSQRMKFLKNYIKKFSKLKGDYYEFGVFQGSSIISVDLIFKKLGIKKKLYGFDSFGGFPSYSKFDSFENFNKLFKKKIITKSHFKDVMNFKKIKNFLRKKDNNKNLLHPKNISTSNDFSNNSLSFLKKKIKLMKLDNIVLIRGNFEKTIPTFFKKNPEKKIFIANIDCDLYDSYKVVLNNIWAKLSKKGIIYLDEYYSLKFPGARIASDEFFKKYKIRPLKIKTPKTDFERWYIKK